MFVVWEEALELLPSKWHLSSRSLMVFFYFVSLIQGTIVQTTLRLWGRCLNSVKYIPCQVPKLSWPLVTGMEMLDPISEALVWDTESSGPYEQRGKVISSLICGRRWVCIPPHCKGNITARKGILEYQSWITSSVCLHFNFSGTMWSRAMSISFRTLEV